MKMAYLLCSALALASGCGDDAVTYVVAGHSLKVMDSGYVTTDLRYCEGAAAGQLKLKIVDYNPICGGTVPAEADGGARDNRLEHNELELIFVTSSHDDPKLPYEVSVPNCDIGPAGPGIATFRHYQSLSNTPEETFATSGEMFLTSLDPTGAQPAKGSFKLVFNGDTLEGDFETYTCN